MTRKTISQAVNKYIRNLYTDHYVQRTYTLFPLIKINTYDPFISLYILSSQALKFNLIYYLRDTIYSHITRYQTPKNVIKKISLYRYLLLKRLVIYSIKYETEIIPTIKIEAGIKIQKSESRVE